jgi:predicted RNA binding protein YcfA (HicA-like mRNA interferase family)
VLKLPVVSGQDLVRALTKTGFEVHHQKGSHIILKQTVSPFARLSVPNHKERKRGLLLSLLRDAGITREQFVQLLEGL